VDGDKYPDVIASDSLTNSVGILFNRGRNYWEKIKRQKEEHSDVWTFIPIIDVTADKLENKVLKDFTIYMVKKSKRINFELFVIYDNKLRIIFPNYLYRLVYRKRFRTSN